MSKLGCKCGHIIVDQTDNIPYKAGYVSDKSIESLYDEVYPNIELFIQSVRNKTREEWVQEFFNPDYAALNLTDAQILSDIFDRSYFAKYRTMYQCENCGRIHIQQKGTNYFFSFLPESDESRNVLDA